ncbi:hypothetical protein F5Y14DRAFT_450970 [Nemania sp. NC0429]|nr:hypothetical protein F5Y14DRAFT_450970 [Nemania sp. NC0429]
MCTGIYHVFCCRECDGVVYKLREAAKGYTCHQARRRGRRGICRTGIEYTHYSHQSEDLCLYCELYNGAEIRNVTAQNCELGDDQWPEDTEEGGALLHQEDPEF